MDTGFFDPVGVSFDVAVCYCVHALGKLPRCVLIGAFAVNETNSILHYK